MTLFVLKVASYALLSAVSLLFSGVLLAEGKISRSVLLGIAGVAWMASAILDAAGGGP